jgi:hypothetical protein
MIKRNFSRRHFIKQSITGSLVIGQIASAVLPASAGATETVDGENGLALQVVGDAAHGYHVACLLQGKPFAQHDGGGEFSGVFQNEERSVEERVNAWKASSWSGNATRVTLSGECKLANLNTTVTVSIDYQVLTNHVVRKRIRLQQADMLLLFYQLSNRLEPSETPAKFWSFDQLNWRGEALREYFPAAGFRTGDGLCVGLLTDAGFRNQWTRMIRRDGRPVKPAPARIPDVNLYSGALAGKPSDEAVFIQQTFGEVLVHPGGEENAQTVALADISSWKKHGPAALASNEGVATITTLNSETGVLIPFAASGPAVYSLNVKYRSTSPVAFGIWNVDEQFRKVSEITLYNDAVPESPAVWADFRTEVFMPGLQGSGCALFISMAPSEQGKNVDAASAAKIEVRDLQLHRLSSHTEPYHRLEMGSAIEKTVFIFADSKVPDTIRGHRLASQLHLAEGLGFQGGDTEKAVYSDLMMLSWIAGPETFRPILAPSIWYSAAGEMYLRDSFFALNGTHNRELNENIFNLWAENQGEDGAINTLVEPNLANVERKSNDSTPLWLMWALLNRRRFGTKLPMKKLRKAAEYCINAYDPRREGLCTAQFVMGQLDVIRYPQGTSVICENQGMLAVTLRVIKELQIPGISETIQDTHLAKAEELYRSYYDPAKKIMRPARDIDDAIGFAEIFPEFLSLWLFQRKILSDEIVVNHLDRIPAMMARKDCPYPAANGTVRPILIGLPEGGKPWRYFTDTWHPMISDSFARGYANHGADGTYYNGGSWMRIEICGYVTGKLHGWTRYKEAIANRLWAEINADPDFPTSQEYIATAPANPFYGYHRVFAWNSFVCQALELAGMRTPEMDPDHSAIAKINL